jgi:hypothetical protein
MLMENSSDTIGNRKCWLYGDRILSDNSRLSLSAIPPSSVGCMSLQEVATAVVRKPSVSFVSFPWCSIARVCGRLRGYDSMMSEPTWNVKRYLSDKVMILYFVNVCRMNVKKRYVSVVNSLEMNSESSLRIFGLCKNCVARITFLDKVNIQYAGTSWKVLGFK